MKRRSWIWKSLLGILVLLGASLFVHREWRGEFCVTCFAERDQVAWVISLPLESGWPVFEKTISQTESIAQERLFDSTHQHRWRTPNVCRRSLVWGEQIHGHPSYSRFIGDYDSDPEFRAFIHDRIQQGELTIEDARRLAELEEPEPMYGWMTPRLGEKRAPLPDGLTREQRRLLQLGRDLFDEYFGETDPPQDWWWTW